MGSKNCPETPRQKMIGMMYLVLTAMLALNVSKDILDAFNVVDDSLTQSNMSVTDAMRSQYSVLFASEEAKADNAKAKAKKLQQLTNDMTDYIEQLRFDLIKYVDGEDSDAVQEAIKEAKKEGRKIPNVPVMNIEGKDNFDKPTHFMLGDNEGNSPDCPAVKLKQKLITYRAEILKLVSDPKKVEKNIKGLSVAPHKDSKTKEEIRWEIYNFDHLITAGTVILLSKMVNEVKNAESTVYQQIIADISAADFKIAEFEGHAIAESKLLFAGDKYRANMVIAAFDPSLELDVYYKMGADTLTAADEASATHLSGRGSGVPMEIDGGGVGEHKFAGIIKIVAPDGKGDGDGYKRFHFKESYTVISKGGATISADKMNVLYAGIANPMTAAGGSDASKLHATFPGCQVASAGAGKYNVTPPVTLVGKTVTATVTTSEGSAQQVYRVKKVPDPTSYIGANIWGGKRSKNELTAQPAIFARMGDDFAFDLKWTVSSYRVTFISKGIEASPIVNSGGAFSENVKNAIKKASTGTVIIFSDIKATSIAGTRTLRDITIRIK